jgi:protein SCO1/2
MRRGRPINEIRYVPGRPLLALAIALLLAAASSARGPVQQPGVDAQEPANPRVGYDQKLGEKVPLDLTFADEDGNEVTLAQCVDGKPTILILAWYKCPSLCGEVLNGVKDAARAMKLTCGKDYSIVTVSIDTKEPPRMAHSKKMYFVTEYGRKEADHGWHFLTTKNEGNIKQLAASVGFRYEWDAMLKEYKHPSGIVILTPDGTISRYFPGIEYVDRGGPSGEVLADPTKTLRLSLVEAGDGKIGSLSDRVFLSCYRFDPHKGAYSFQVLWIMRAGGLLTLLILALVYARFAWKLPGGRLLVVGILVYGGLVLPVIMFTSFSVDSIPRWALKASVVPLGLAVFLVARWIWKSAKTRQAKVEAAPPVASA